MYLERISIDQLEPGMLVVSIDAPWKNCPFRLDRRTIRTVDEVQDLKAAGVKTLTIDKSHTLKTGQPSPPSPWLPSSSLQEEIASAKKLQQESKKIVGQACLDIKRNKPPLAAPLSQLIRLTLASLARNNQALLGLLNLTPKHDKLVAHLFNVMSLSLAMGTQLNCSESEKEVLGLAAFIHDAGWVRLPLNLLDKRTPYNVAETALIERHTSMLAPLLLSSQGFDPQVNAVIEDHHERLDGTGYPNKKLGHQIHKLAKILTIANYYDEYVHGIAGHYPRPPTTVLKLLYRMARNGAFDEAMVAALINLVSVYPVNCVVELENGEVALVVELNHKQPLYPKIKVIYSAQGSAYPEPKYIDLLETISTQHPNKVVKALDPSKPENDPAGIIQREFEAISGEN